MNSKGILVFIMKNRILLFTATIIALFYSTKSTVIPKQTGTYSIGRTTIHLVDELSIKYVGFLH